MFPSPARVEALKLPHEHLLFVEYLMMLTSVWYYHIVVWFVFLSYLILRFLSCVYWPFCTSSVEKCLLGPQGVSSLGCLYLWRLWAVCASWKWNQFSSVASIPNRLILIHSICWLSFSLFYCFPLWLKSVLVSVSFMYFVFISVAWVDWPKVDIVPFYVSLIGIVDLFMEFLWCHGL